MHSTAYLLSVKGNAILPFQVSLNPDVAEPFSFVPFAIGTLKLDPLNGYV